MTRDQLDIAAATRDELLLMFEDANAVLRSALALEGVCKHFELAALDGALIPCLGQAVLDLSAAHDAYAEYVAAINDAAAPLKAAA